MRLVRSMVVLLAQNASLQTMLVLGGIILVALLLIALPFLGLLAPSGAEASAAVEPATEDAGARPRLPGTSVSGYQRGLSIFLALLAVGLIVLDGLLTDWDAVGRGRLVWPALQWAFTTPPGALATAALGAVPIGLLLACSQRHTWRRYLAHAADLTGQPPPPRSHAAYPPPYPGPARPRRQRTREERLAIAGFIVVPLVLLIFVLFPLGFYIKSHPAPCYAAGCPTLPVMAIPTVSYILGVWIAVIATTLWLHGVETRAGVWLRYNQPAGNVVDYVRRPDTSPEQARRALDRLAPRSRGVVARTLAVFPFASLVFALMILLQIVAMLLVYWLQVQWTSA